MRRHSSKNKTLKVPKVKINPKVKTPKVKIPKVKIPKVKTPKVPKIPKVSKGEIAFECKKCHHKIYYKKGERSSDIAVNTIQNGCHRCHAIDTELRAYLMKITSSKPIAKSPKPKKN